MSHYSFDLRFSNNSRSLAPFLQPVSHLYVFLEKCLFRCSLQLLIELLLFFGGVLSCMSCFSALEIKPLSVTLFANIFSQSIDFLFILFMNFFIVQKLISLLGSHLFIFLLFLSPWQTDLRKRCYNLCKRMFCLCYWT